MFIIGLYHKIDGEWRRVDYLHENEGHLEICGFPKGNPPSIYMKRREARNAIQRTMKYSIKEWGITDWKHSSRTIKRIIEEVEFKEVI